MSMRLVAVIGLASLVCGCCCPSPCEPGPAPEPAPAPAPEVLEVPPEPKVMKPSGEPTLSDILYQKRLRGLHWEDMNLTQVTTYLRTITGVPFELSERTKEEKFEDVLITLKINDASVGSILTLITEQNELRWEERDGKIWILTTSETQGDLRLRYYDIKDLIRPEQEHGFSSDDDAVATLQERAFPKYWRDTGPAMEARKGILIVRASKGVHHEIERELNRERSKLQAPGLHKAHKDRFEKIRVNLSVDKQALVDVVKTLQIQTGLNLTIDSRIHADVKDVTIVALKAKDMPLTTVLEMVAGQAGDSMLWISRGNVAVLTTREFAN